MALDKITITRKHLALLLGTQLATQQRKLTIFIADVAELHFKYAAQIVDSCAWYLANCKGPISI